MKVLVVTRVVGQASGYGNYSLNMIKEIRAKGHEVVVLCHKTGMEMSGVKQIPILPAPLSFKRLFLIPNVYVWRALAYRDLFEDADVVHTFVETYSLFTFCLAKKLRKPFFVTLHGSYALVPFRYVLYGTLQKCAFRHAKGLIAVSSYTHDAIARYCTDLPTTVINNGISYTGSRGVKSVRKKNVLLSVGAVKWRKGYHISLRVFCEAHKRVDDLVYYIAGREVDTGYISQLKEYLRKNNIAHNVRFLGQVSNEKLEYLYEQARVFILMPVSFPFYFEGFGLVYLEANARGIPAIGMKGSGAIDAIAEGKSGFIVSEGDYRRAADKLVELLGNEVLYKKMSKESQEWAQSHQWGIQVNKYINFYTSS